MNAVSAFARLALHLCPSEFRAQYGDQVLSDIESDPERASHELLDLIGTGIAMHIDGLIRDVSYALRRLRSAPLFVAIVVLTFALGIGANVAVFSVLNAVVLRPLPFLNPSGVVAIRQGDLRRPLNHPALSIDDVNDLRTQTRGIAQIAAIGADNGTFVPSGGKPVALGGYDVMPDYFSVLGISTQVGRPLNAGDARPGVKSIVISDGIWRRYFRADPSVVGKTLLLDAVSYRIVGVTKPGQLFANPTGSELIPADFIEALPENAPPKERGSRYLAAVARLAPGTSVDALNAELRVVSKRLEKLYPEYDTGIVYDASPLSVALLGEVASMLWVVFASVIGILLIACANVANLLGARWSTRDREFALRRALGASWKKIAGQLFVETALLAAIGGVVGIVTAYAALAAAHSTVLRDLPRGTDVSLDASTLVYAFCVVVATALIAAIYPISMMRERDLQLVLKNAGRGGSASTSHALRSGLVVAEVALALALVVITGLMVRSFVSLARTPLGIRPQGVLVTDIVSLPEKTYPLPARISMQHDLLRRLRALPGVDRAALTVRYPLGDISLSFDAPVLGESYANGAEPVAGGNDISPDYFHTMGVPLLRGRDFSDADTPSSAPVAIVNQSFVRAFLHRREAVGTKIRVAGWNGTIARWATIVGVVADERANLSRPPMPMFYAPVTQAPPSFLAAVVHGSAARTALTNEISGAFSAAAPSIEPPQVYTMDDRVALNTKQARLSAMLLGALSIVALLLALAGVFGVMSFSVTQRIHEFGIRIALGASTANIVADVLRRAALTACAGILCGVIIAAVGANAIAAQLHEVSPFDPLTFTVVIVLLFACACAAAVQPAIRATRVQPAVSLRYE